MLSRAHCKQTADVFDYRFLNIQDYLQMKRVILKHWTWEKSVKDREWLAIVWVKFEKCGNICESLMDLDMKSFSVLGWCKMSWIQDQPKRFELMTFKIHYCFNIFHHTKNKRLKPSSLYTYIYNPITKLILILRRKSTKNPLFKNRLF